jgi:cytochrome b
VTADGGQPGVSAGARPADTILVWDLPTRAFHWLLFASLCGSWISAEAGIEWREWHMRLGYLALGLVAFRVLWGFAGTRHARFTSFVRGPAASLRYLRALLAGPQAPRHAGHNPAGGAMVLLLLALVAVQAGSGLFVDDDIMYAGPYAGAVSEDLADALEALHHRAFTLLQVAVVLHVAAVGWHCFRGEPLVAAMWHGRKPATGLAAADGIERAFPWHAVAVIGVAVAAVVALVLLAPPPPLDDY